ncbi:MAG TPA: hypothetical protein VFL83_18680 [Anaeromyxobacter sp.]|nr:hypothetical protein [Anaeromyxobacter sp.]
MPWHLTSWPHHRTAVLLASLASAAVLVDLGALHALEHADAIVPVLVSLQRWTPFYWDQERYGMLVPLLALPVRDPFWNLLLQRGLLVLAGLAAVLLLARHVLAGRDWPLAGLAAAGGLLLAAPAPWLFEFLGDQPYGLSVALALAGLAVAEPGPDRRRRPMRLAWGLVLVVAAHWVNAATGVFLLLLAAGRAAADLLEGEDAAAVVPRLGVDGALLAAGLAAGQAFLFAYPALSGQPLRLATGMLPASAWPHAWGAFLGNAWAASAPWGAALAGAAALGAALLATRPLRAHLPAALVRAAALAAAALAYALFAGSLRWVEENAFHWRYLAPSAVLVHLAATSLLAEPLARLPRLARGSGAGALALVPLAALAAYGPPSPARARADLDRVAGAHTADVLAARCALVAGDYWSVWPAVWHARLALRERGDPREVWGVTHRTRATVLQWWADRASLRICRPRGEDAAAERWLRAFHLWPARVVERRATLDVLEPAPPTAAPAAG